MRAQDTPLTFEQHEAAFASLQQAQQPWRARRADDTTHRDLDQTEILLQAHDAALAKNAR